jgi:hypothetical protein
VPNVSEVFGESIQQSGAVAPALHARANAHLLEEEVVVGSRTFQMTDREAEQFSVGVPRTDTVGAGSSEEVAEPLSSILRVPRLVPRRCIEGVDVEGDTSAKRFARQSGDHAEPWHGARTDASAHRHVRASSGRTGWPPGVRYAPDVCTCRQAASRVEGHHVGGIR